MTELVTTIQMEIPDKSAIMVDALNRRSQIMTEDIQQTERWAEFEQVLTKTAVDREFRAAFLDDPKGVLRREGMDVSDEIEIQVIDDDPDKVVITLPPFIGDQLDADQLETLSGGLPRNVREVLGHIALPLVLVNDRIRNPAPQESGTYNIQRWMRNG